eukprot:sb/3465909/
MVLLIEAIKDISSYVPTLDHLHLLKLQVFPPTEFHSVGLSIESFFSRWLGDESLHFTKYHVKLTTTRLVVHSLLLPGYYLMSTLFFDATDFTPLPFLLTILPSITASVLAIYWHSLGTWSAHPLCKILAAHAQRPHDWRTVANALATEFRRVDKFVHGRGWGKIVVTDTWIVRCGLYTVSAAYQPDIHLLIESTSEYTDPTTQQTVQYVNINVSSINEACHNFSIRLNSLDFDDLKAKLSAPLLNVRNVVFHQTLSDKFELAFRDEVSQNGLYQNSRMGDECIGCLYAPADIKLSKMCADLSEGDCRNCLCRPMWCLKCLVKWFVNRQEQNRPESWLGGTAPCPTCRSVFCIRDVQMIATPISTE